MVGVGLLLGLWLTAVPGLSLYSYTDERGRLIVVDALEKVPPQYRDRVREGVVRPFAAAGARAPDRVSRPSAASPRLEAIPDEPAPAPAPANLGADLRLQEPPPETALATEPAWATASRWLDELGRLQDRGEKLWLLARGVSPTDTRVYFLRTEALQALEDLRACEAMTWDRAGEWVAQARALTDRFRTIFFAISRWLAEGGKALVTELPPLLAQTRKVLEHLRRTLPAPLLLEVPLAGTAPRSLR
ncbi:MAG: hypothetical protein OZSIB_2075 [Candidatus Ozemobacter sibiricus]|uniref:DUF4124 domain-containing protein n=1 Tax=Candidatus Ozemobacter sibiricus TaxID=2268124 RepID=A0A367ZT36_9BACT|nr:MAG: hypothetical protein OZSIB_2075 [Candidatus Ozemobacter sibiricus]